MFQMSSIVKIIAYEEKIEALEQKLKSSMLEERLEILHRINAKENQLTELYKLNAPAGKSYCLVHSTHRIYTS